MGRKLPGTAGRRQKLHHCWCHILTEGQVPGPADVDKEDDVAALNVVCLPIKSLRQMKWMRYLASGQAGC